MSSAYAASTTPSPYPGNLSPCQGDTCSLEGYMWFALVAATCFPFVAFCCCCICNKWYLTSGPFAGLTDQEICAPGNRCVRPCWLVCAWCCGSLVPPPPPPPPTADGNATASVDLSLTPDAAAASAAVVAAVYSRSPPSYDEALSMARPSDGEIVIFVSGCDDALCSFRFSKGSCDPPAYSFPGGN